MTCSRSTSEPPRVRSVRDIGRTKTPLTLSVPPALELQPGRQLDDARVLRRRVLPELRVQLRAGGVELRVGVHSAELHVVECVVKLGSKLHAQTLVQANILEQGDVPVVQAGTAEQDFGGIAQRAHG